MSLVDGLSEDTIVSFAGFYEPDGIRGGILRPAGEDSRDSQVSPVIPARLASELKLNGGELIEVAIASRDLHHRVVLQDIEAFVSIDGRDIDGHHDFVRLEELPRAESTDRLAFSTEGGPLAMRILDLFAPLGTGHRGLIVTEPKTGKTILLQQIAHAMAQRHPDAEVMILLIGEMPEEVTDMRRSIPGTVISSSNYQGSRNHLRTAELTLMRAKRLVESGKDVLVLIDSLTELARAYNTEVRDPQRIIDDELSPLAIDRILELLDCAVDVEDGGSLTILATASVGTGSELDDMVFEAVRESANMKVFLSAELAALRIWPAIDIARSSTGMSAELLNKAEIGVAEDFRKKLAGGAPEKVLPALHKKMRQYESSGDLLKATT